LTKDQKVGGSSPSKRTKTRFLLTRGGFLLSLDKVAVDLEIDWPHMQAHTNYLLKQVRVVRLKGSDVDAIDVRIAHGLVVETGLGLSPNPGEQVIDGEGRWVIPGLWDQHVHMGLWSESSSRLDLSSALEASEVLELVKQQVVSGAEVIIGAGFRKSTWTSPAGTRELDEVTGDIPTVLISGDVHCGWLNSAAYKALGLSVYPELMEETPWFELMPRIPELEAGSGSVYDRYTSAIKAAHAQGIVGIRDYEFADDYDFWPKFVAAGAPKLRVKVAVYPHLLDKALADGVKTGTQLAPLVEMGSLKMISDGSLGTMTAYCCEPYGTSESHPYGKQNYKLPEMIELLSKAKAGGLEISLHTIGDAAGTDAIDAFEATGAKGRIEHAQLLKVEDVHRMGRLGIGASVQPLHLVDDREMTFKHWPDRQDRCYLFGTMLRSGVPLTLGSDAPVAPIDPWGAIQAAVLRAREGDEPWNPAEVLTVGEALFASVDFQPPVGVGSRADLVLLDHDPHMASLSNVGVSLTMIDGTVVFDARNDLA